MRNLLLLCCLILALGLFDNSPASAQALPGTPVQVVDDLGQPVGFLAGGTTYSIDILIVSIEIDGEVFMIETRTTGVNKNRIFYDEPGCTGQAFGHSHFRSGGWFGRKVLVDGLDRAWSMESQGGNLEVRSKLGVAGVCTNFATPKVRSVRPLVGPPHGTLPEFEGPLRLQGSP